MEFLHSLKRKKHQRRINSILRDLNESLKNDHLTRDISCKQLRHDFKVYEDGSGAVLYVLIRLTNEKTGMSETFWTSSVQLVGPAGAFLMFSKLNDFICKNIDP